MQEQQKVRTSCHLGSYLELVRTGLWVYTLDPIPPHYEEILAAERLALWTLITEQQTGGRMTNENAKPKGGTESELTRLISAMHADPALVEAEQRLSQLEERRREIDVELDAIKHRIYYPRERSSAAPPKQTERAAPETLHDRTLADILTNKTRSPKRSLGEELELALRDARILQNAIATQIETVRALREAAGMAALMTARTRAHERFRQRLTLIRQFRSAMAQIDEQEVADARLLQAQQLSPQTAPINPFAVDDPVWGCVARDAAKAQGIELPN